MRIRILSLALSLSMLASLAACAPSAGPTPSGGAPADDGAASAEWSLPYRGDPVTITLLGWESFSKVNPQSKFGQWFQERIGNIALEIDVPAEGTETRQELALASGDMPDILNYRDAAKFMKNYGDGSRTKNLYDYKAYMPEYFARREQYPHLSSHDPDENTNYLFFPVGYDATSEVWFMNQDLMDKYGLQAPKNYDEMVACMEAVHQAEPDRYGIHLYTWGFGYQFNCYATLFGSKGIGANDIWYDREQKKWVYALEAYSDVYRNTAQAMYDAYAKGLLHPDFMNMSEDLWLNNRNNGQSLFMFHYSNIMAADEKELFKFKPTYIDPPAAAGTKPCVRADFNSDGAGWMYMINKDTKYPELCASLLELFGSKEMAETFYWGWEGQSYAVDANGKRSFLPAFAALPKDEVKNAWGITSVEPYTFMPTVSSFYVGDAIAAMWSDEAKRASTIAAEKLKSGDYVFEYNRSGPDFDDDTKERIGLTTTAINTYTNENLTAFVLGNRPMSEWDAFLAGIEDVADMAWVLERYNAAEQKPERLTQFERHYLIP